MTWTFAFVAVGTLLDSMLYAVVGLTVLVAVVLGFRVRSRLATPSGSNRPVIGDSLWPFVQPYRWALLLSGGLTLLATAVDLASPWPFKVMVDNAIGGEPLPSWLGLLSDLDPAVLAAVAAIAGVVLILVSSLLAYLVSIVIGGVEIRIGADMRATAFMRLQNVSMRFHDRNRTGDLVSRLHTDVAKARELLIAWFDRILPQVLTLAGMLVIMLAVDVELTLVALTVVPFLWLYAVLKRPVIRAAHRRARDSKGAVAAYATDVLRNVRAVQAFSRQWDEGDRYERQNAEAADDAVAALEVEARYRPVGSMLLAVGSGFVGWLGVVKVINGELSLGTLLVVLAYMGGLFGPIRSLSALASTMAKGAASRDRLMELFADEHLVVEPAEPRNAPDGPLEVHLDHVEFAYEPGVPVLRDVQLVVRPLESVCIVGPTGAGKSTLLSLLLRLYDPDAGTIRIDGVDIRDVSLASLRDLFAVVPQDAWIIDGTICDNIAFGRDEASESDLRTAGESALVDEFASRLPDGYDSNVGEGGELLSGGQRRRVALARALIRDAPVLLLDEPTSGLDAAAESDVIRALESARRGRTAITVSHRLNVARFADRIIVLEDGVIVEDGTHDELLTKAGRYATLWNTQNGGLPMEEEPTGRVGNQRGEGGEQGDDERSMVHVPDASSGPVPHDHDDQPQLEQLELLI